MRRPPIVLMALLFATASAGPLAGQASEGGRVTLVIRPVLHMETETTAEERVESGDRVDVRGELRVRVSANGPWRLVVRARQRAGDVTGPAGRGSALVMRVQARSGAGTAPIRTLAPRYTRLVAGSLDVAEGSAGADQEVVLRYWWSRPAGEGVEGLDGLLVELAER